MTQGVFFDLDGTLVNSLNDICGILNLVRLEYGLKALPNPHIRGAIGIGVENLIHSCFTELPKSEMPNIINKYREFYLRDIAMGGELYPGVGETLRALRAQGIATLGVVTNKPALVAVKTLEHYLPLVPFDIVAGPETVSERKPSPKHLLETLEKVGVSPSKAWFIGDDPVDLACAEASGVRFLGAGWGFGGVQPGADRLVMQFSDILKKIVIQ